MKSLLIAFSMYSKFPVPQVEWDKKSLSWALCWFPLVGAVIGLFLFLWLNLWSLLGLTALGAAGAVALPIALSGAIHMDGFCDTCDALSSRQSRERKLEILKDSHTGAFAIICCCLYLLIFFAAWLEIDISSVSFAIPALIPALSRCLSALAAVTWKNARGTGLLATFTEPMDAQKARWLLLAQFLLLVCLMGSIDPWLGGLITGAAALIFVFYRFTAYRQFGGITGDTAGWFLQLCECAMVLAMVLGQKVEAFL